MTWTPWYFLVVAIAGWMNRQQQVIEYLRTENQVLREKLGHGRTILNESQKVRLATGAMKLGKDLSRQFGTLFSPATLLQWNRWFVAREYDGSGKRGPSPRRPTAFASSCSKWPRPTHRGATVTSMAN
jgi:putative transposase